MKRMIRLLLILMLAESWSMAFYAGGQTSKSTKASDECTNLEEMEYPVCSTEKINHKDCEVVIDRRYPVTWPTIQMKPGKHVRVVVRNPLDFESLSLDETSFSLLQGTDQLASLVPSLIPQLKGFGATSVSIPQAEVAVPFPPQQPGVLSSEQQKQAARELGLVDLIHKQEEVMRALLNTAVAGIPDEKSGLFTKVRAIYEQLNQVMVPLPKPGSKNPQHYTPPTHAPGTPNPWTDYQAWRFFLLCEMVGGSVDSKLCPTQDDPKSIPPFVDVLGTLSGLQAQLPSSAGSQPANALFDQATFDGLAKTITSEIPKLTTEQDRSDAVKQLNGFQQAETQLLARLSVLSSTLGSIQKDLLTYYQNVLLATDALPKPRSDDKGAFSVIGFIFDPSNPKCMTASSPYPHFLGRQVAYAVNAVNNVATSQTSIVGQSNKTSLSTVTVLYANPRFETSAGAIVSFVHNRTFVNQTISNASAGSPFANGEIVIGQTKTDPELVPFVAGHWRIGNEFLMPGHRRGAFYGSIWGGLNPYVNVPDFGAGPTISWRSMMVSFLYNRAHQTSLIAGEYQNEPVCGPTPTGSTVTVPPCTGTPPAPVTKTTALNAFAIGISVRIPTSFASGGVSR